MLFCCESYFFVEVDWSTEPRSVLSDRIHGYLEYYKRNGLAHRFGLDASGCEVFPFRVLIVWRRMNAHNSLADHILRENTNVHGTFVWFTSLQSVLSRPMDSIWMSIGEYLRVMQRTAFAPYTHRSKDYRYVTNPEREYIVTLLAEKCCVIQWD